MNEMMIGRLEFGPIPAGTFDGWLPYYHQPTPRCSPPALPEFHEFPKIARLSRKCVITEKIDGTNACIYIGEDGQFLTGSRTRWITPDDDNFGFSKWAHDHKDELMQLRPGRHFGEWWGVGIQRGYGLSERRFSLFNTSRWGDLGTDRRPACCHVVPVLFQGVFHSDEVAKALVRLSVFGSAAAPGFMKPKGVVYHTAANLCFQENLRADQPKFAHIKKERPPKPLRDLDIGGRRKGGGVDYVGHDRRKA